MIALNPFPGHLRVPVFAVICGRVANGGRISCTPQGIARTIGLAVAALTAEGGWHVDRVLTHAFRASHILHSMLLAPSSVHDLSRHDRLH